MELEILVFVISVPIPIPVPIPKFTNGLKRASYNMEVIIIQKILLS